MGSMHLIGAMMKDAIPWTTTEYNQNEMCAYSQKCSQYLWFCCINRYGNPLTFRSGDMTAYASSSWK